MPHAGTKVTTCNPELNDIEYTFHLPHSIQSLKLIILEIRPGK